MANKVRGYKVGKLRGGKVYSPKKRITELDLFEPKKTVVSDAKKYLSTGKMSSVGRGAGARSNIINKAAKIAKTKKLERSAELGKERAGTKAKETVEQFIKRRNAKKR